MSDTKKTKSKTFKTCEVEQDFEYMEGATLDDIEERIQRLGVVSYCLVEHDKDKKDDGSPRAPHFHAILTFGKTPKAVTTISTAIGVEPQYVNKIKTTTTSAQVYLCHVNAPNKYQYSVSDVRANFDYASLVEKWKAKQKQKSTLEQIVDRIQRGEIREYNLTEYVDTITYAKNRTLLENALRWFRMARMTNKDRHINVLFFEGETGTGKTTYAKRYCENQKFSYCISSSSNDPMQDYKGEDVLILDDIRDDSFKYHDFLKLLDNHTSSTTQSRYNNKAFIGETIIITTAKPLVEWYVNIKEDKKQFYRRLTSHFVFGFDKITIFDVDDKGNESQIARVDNVLRMPLKVTARKTFDVMRAMGIEFNSDLEQSVDDTINDMPDDMPLLDAIENNGYTDENGNFVPF